MTPKAKPRPTIGLVAARARVAPTTVSRVLNGGYVSAEARSRVERVIKELGYVPSPTARSLKYGRRGCIGVAAEYILGPWFIGLLEGIDEELAKSRLSVMLGGWRLRGRYDSSTVMAWISERRVDGLILARFTKREQPLLTAAQQAGIPTVFICPDETASVGFTVRCRNYEAGRAVAEHLIGLGHRRIAFAGGPPDSLDSLDRLRGLRDGVAGVRGATVQDADVSFAKNYDGDSGIGPARALLERPRSQWPSAVVVGNDVMALTFMRELLKAGVRIPEEVSVVGFDGIAEGARFFPAVTTVAQPMALLGKTACRSLLERIERAEPDQVVSVEYPMELVVRESTGPAPRLAAAAPARRRRAATQA